MQSFSHINTFAHPVFSLGASIIITLISTYQNPTHFSRPNQNAAGLPSQRDSPFSAHASHSAYPSLVWCAALFAVHYSPAVFQLPPATMQPSFHLRLHSLRVEMRPHAFYLPTLCLAWGHDWGSASSCDMIE